MAERPIFVPVLDGPGLVREISVRMHWSPGFAPVQKKKNIEALHGAAALMGYAPLLEVSTKSDEKLGRHLSSFHLKVKRRDLSEIPLECAFQGSKVFQHGGPYTDLYSADVRAAKQDPRLKSSGAIVRFVFDDLCFPLEPKTVFYDWLYLNAIYPYCEWLTRLYRYSGFTDIEFNPKRSINCQARSCALFVALKRKGQLEDTLTSPGNFVDVMTRVHPYQAGQAPRTLFSH